MRRMVQRSSCGIYSLCIAVLLFLFVGATAGCSSSFLSAPCLVDGSGSDG